MSPLKSSRSLRLLTGFIILLAVAGIAVSLKTPAAHAQTGFEDYDTSGPGPLAQIATSVKDAVIGSLTSISNIATNVVGWVIYAILYFLIFVFVSPLIALLTYFITIILQLNGNVMNTLAVQTGFQVTLAVANLGFVLGIIIIAIATILHRQTYGVKSLLWKLVLAAILVNFSLIIGGVIINAANSLTTVFLKPFPGGGNGVAGFTGFANALAGAFAPHRSFLVGLDKYSQSFTNTAAQGSASTLSQSAIGSQLAPLFSIFFAAAMSIAILITLAIFVLMLLMRYMWLTFLLIVMPIVWLFWIFPYTASHWKKWWHEFLRWTFFPPIVIFFLYLAVATAGQMSSDNAKGGPFDVSKGLSGLGYTPDPNTPPIISDISAYFGGAVNSVLGTAMQLVVVVGLAVGGLYAANKFSIDGAALGMKALTGVKNAAVGYAGKQGKKGLRAGFRAVGGEGAVQRMRTGEFAKTLSGIPVIGKPADWALKRGASVVGRAIEPHLGNEKMVGDAKKNVPKDPKKIKENLSGNMNMEDKFAHVAKLLEMNELDNGVMVGNQKVQDFMDEHGEDVKNYGQGKMSEDADKALGSTKEMRDAAKEFEALRKAGEDTTEALKRLDAATKTFVEKLGKGDMSKMNVNDVFKESSKDTALTQALARNMAKHGSHLVSSALPKMKSPALKAFAETYRKEIKSELDKGPTAKKLAAVSPTLTKEERDRVVKKIREGMTEEERILDRAQKSFNDALANNVLFGSPADASTGAAAPPPPPATPHP